MPRPELTQAQTDSLLAKLRPMLGYMNRLHRRMEKSGLPPDDRLLAMVVEARTAVYKLTMAVNDASGRGRVGRGD
jgi:hypothetical protein